MRDESDRSRKWWEGGNRGKPVGRRYDKQEGRGREEGEREGRMKEPDE